MVLDLRGAFEGEGFHKEFSYELDMSGYEDFAGNKPFKEPVKVSGSVVNKAGLVKLHVETESDYHTQCDRCCLPVCEHLNVPFDNVLTNVMTGEGENGDIIDVRDNELDVDKLVQANIILNIPMKHLCRENCKGLCPNCGKNLNDGECECGSKNS